jgi:hypothetical protein
MFGDERVKLQDLNQFILEAKWLSDSRFEVTRKLDGIPRGKWVFEHTRKNQWKFIEATPVHLRRRYDYDYWGHQKEVPHDIQMKAKDFLRDAKLVQTRYLKRDSRLKRY